MQAVILAAGEGLRLAPLTAYIPKPLLPIEGKPVIVHTIESLALSEIDEILVCVNDAFVDQFEYHLSSFKKGVKIISHPAPQGTAGELLSIRQDLEDEFLVYYGDIWTKTTFRNMVHSWNHLLKPALGMMAVAPKYQIDRGVPVIDERRRIVFLQEKPLLDIPTMTGISIFRKEILKFAREGQDLNGQVVPRAIQAGKVIYAYTFDQPWVDIGTIDAYRKAAGSPPSHHA